MGLFKRKSEEKHKPINAGQDEVAGRIANALLGAQLRWAQWLNIWALKLGRNKSMLIMALLGLGFGLWCLYLVIGVLF